MSLNKHNFLLYLSAMIVLALPIFMFWYTGGSQLNSTETLVIINNDAEDSWDLSDENTLLNENQIALTQFIPLELNHEDAWFSASPDSARNSSESHHSVFTLRQVETSKSEKSPNGRSSHRQKGDDRYEKLADTMAKARKAARQKKYDLAERLYRSILLEYPNHQGAGINLGLMLKKRKRYDDAIHVLKNTSAIASGRRKGKALALLADTYSDAGQAEVAIPLFKKAIEFRPSHALTWLNLAEAQSRSQQPWYISSSSYRRALSLAPKNLKTRLKAVEFELNALNPEGALAYLNDKRAKGSNKQIHWYKSWAHILAGKEQAAVENLEWLMKHEKKIEKLAFYKSIIQVIDTDSYTKELFLELKLETQHAIDRGDDLFREERKLLLLIAALKAQKNNALDIDLVSLEKLVLPDIKSDDDLSKEMQKANNTGHLYGHYFALNWARLNANRHPHEALELMESILTNPVKFHAISKEMLLLSMNLGNKDKAISIAEKSISMLEDMIDHDSYYSKNSNLETSLIINYASTYLHFDMLRNALTVLLPLSKRYPDNVEVKHVLAKILLNQNRQIEAVELLSSISEKQRNQSILYDLALALSQVNQLKEANIILESLTESQSTHIPTRLLLANNLCSLKQYAACHKQAALVLKLDRGNEQAIKIQRLAASEV